MFTRNQGIIVAIIFVCVLLVCMIGISFYYAIQSLRRWLQGRSPRSSGAQDLEAASQSRGRSRTRTRSRSRPAITGTGPGNGNGISIGTGISFGIELSSLPGPGTPNGTNRTIRRTRSNILAGLTYDPPLARSPSPSNSFTTTITSRRLRHVHSSASDLNLLAAPGPQPSSLPRSHSMHPSSSPAHELPVLPATIFGASTSSGFETAVGLVGGPHPPAPIAVPRTRSRLANVNGTPAGEGIWWGQGEAPQKRLTVMQDDEDQAADLEAEYGHWI